MTNVDQNEHLRDQRIYCNNAISIQQRRGNCSDLVSLI